MAKFNRGGALHGATSGRATSAITTGGQPDTRTAEGGPGYLRSMQGELFLLAVSNLVGEDTFYEQATDRDKRFAKLVRQVAIEHPVWTFELLTWLRDKANMRSASVVGAVEAVHAWLARPTSGKAWYEFESKVNPWLEERAASGDKRGIARALIDGVCQRADEPGELVAYYVSRYGRSLPKPVKRGLADAVRRLYTEYALLKYDTATRGGGNGYRFGDVIELTHARPSHINEGDAQYFDQSALFKHAIDRRHGRSIDTEEERLDISLPTVQANHVLRFLVDQAKNSQSKEFAGANRKRRIAELLTDTGNLRGAGMTWEDALSLAGDTVPKAALWDALIPTMGYMALLRNLRNFDEAGIGRQSAEFVQRKLADPNQVDRSRQFPFRFYSAYMAAPNSRWVQPLDEALTRSCSNIPLLRGRTLVLCDTSGSMSWGHVSNGSKRTYAEVAALFAIALAVRAASPDGKRANASLDLVGFATTQFHHQVRVGGSVLPELRRFTDRIGEAGGGTDIAGAVHAGYDGHDRVIIISDMQTMDSGLRGWQLGGYSSRSNNVDRIVPAHVPVYGFNLAGYRAGAIPSGGGNRHEFGGGLTDAAFRLIPLLEAGERTGWPWQPADQAPRSTVPEGSHGSGDGVWTVATGH